MKSATKITRIANQLEEEIRTNERYVPGAPFLTSRQLASDMKISGTVANNVLKLLEMRQVIVRRQRKGAFIADAQTKKAGHIDKLLILTGKQYFKHKMSSMQDVFIITLQECFPGTSITFQWIDDPQHSPSISDTIQSLFSDNRRTAFILWTASLEVQRLFSESKLPAIAFGTRHRSIENLPSVDSDHDAVAQLLVEYLKKRDRRRFVMLCHAGIAAGDQKVIAAFHKRIGPEILAWEFLPYDVKTYEEAARDLWDEYEPDAFICQTNEMAYAALEVCRRRHLSLGKEVDIVSVLPPPGSRHPFPCPEPALGYRGLVEVVAKTVRDRFNTGTAEDVALPVRLKLPDENETA